MSTQATTVPLVLPGGVVFDSEGNLFFTETGGNLVRRVSPAGVLTTYAGTGTQGFSGDGALATSAWLDSPTGLAIGPSGDLYIADAHNHRIRRVQPSGIISTYAGTGVPGMSPDGVSAASALIDLPSALAFDPAANLYFSDARRHVVRRIDHLTGVVSTVVGNGSEGFSGDLGPATLAEIDSPYGLAFDGSGNLLVSDTHNQRIRRIDASTGIITSIAGTGQPGFAGDSAPATTASFRLPRGLVMDSSGNLFVVDSSNHRVRRIDAVSGQITTIAGNGVQAYAGDSQAAVSASLNTPRAMTLSPSALPTVSDTGNERIRQVDSTLVIHTIAGLGATGASALILSAPSVVSYGSGSVAATLTASPATGSVTFFDSSQATPQTLFTVALSGNLADFSTGALNAGLYRIDATYAGDAAHSAAESNTLSLTVSPLALVEAPAPVTVLYGQAIPALSGRLTGLLPRDTTTVNVALSTAAVLFSPPAMYPIVAALTGSSAGNYTLSTDAAAVTISKAPSTATLSSGLLVHVAPATAGVPTGTVELLDGATLLSLATLDARDNASFAASALSTGTHTLTAVYGGDANFLAASSPPLIVSVGPALTADFSLSATGQTTVSANAGSAAAFSFAVAPVNGALSSPIELSATGLPQGATASFNPAYLPPANAPAAFILTVQTRKAALLKPLTGMPTFAFGMLIPVLLLGRRRRAPRVTCLSLFLLMTGTGCGNRVNNSAENGSAGATYTLTVNATATSSNGASLLHSATVTLVVQ